MNKKIILIFVLLAVVISGVLIWQFWLKGKAPSPSPTITPIITPTDITANWPFYSNDEYGYQIKFPADWDMTKCLKTIVFAPKNTIETINQAGCAVGSGKEFVLTINYRTKEQYENVILANRKTDEYKIVTLESVIVNGLEAKRYSSEFIKDTSLANSGEVFTDVLVPCQDGYLEITLLDNQYLDIFNKIISFFKFVENEVPDKECRGEDEILCDVMGCKLCCPGLKPLYFSEPYRSKEGEIVCIEGMTRAVCVNCGNSICGTGENWCFCPEDCPKPDFKDLELYSY